MTNDADKRSKQRLVTVGDLRRQRVCKKRYGRATVTIRRFGPGLVGRHPLAAKIDAFREGGATVEEVAWSFIEARIESRSPTFPREAVDRSRLLRLVVECSSDPKFSSADPEAVAGTLLAAQDAEKKQLEKLARTMSHSFSRAADLSKIVSPPHLRWVEQQRRTFVTLERILSGPAQMAEQMEAVTRTIDAVSGARSVADQLARQMREREEMLAGLVWPQRSALLATALRLQESPLLELTRSMRATIEATHLRPLTSALEELLAKETVTVTEVLDAARSAAGVLDDSGAHAQAEELEAVTDEVEEVIEYPSLERLERMIADLSDKIDEDSKKRDLNEQDALVLQLFLFFLQVYLTVFVWLVGPPTQ